MVCVRGRLFVFLERGRALFSSFEQGPARSSRSHTPDTKTPCTHTNTCNNTHKTKVVFKRPVIALGADFGVGAGLPDSLVRFFLACMRAC